MLDRTAAQPISLDHLFHTVICRHRGGYFTAERDLSDMGRAATIRDIITGQVENVVKVIAWSAVDHVADDVTEDIAIEIANGLEPGEPISVALRDFIEENAGIDYARGLRVFDCTFEAA